MIKKSITSLMLGILVLSSIYILSTSKTAVSKMPKSTVHVNWIDYSFDELVAISEYIVQGKIINKLDTYFISFNDDVDNGVFYTDYEFEVKKYYKNNTTEFPEKLVISRIGSDDMVIPSFPPFKVNDQFILFIQREESGIVQNKLVVSPLGTYKKIGGNKIQATYGINKEKSEDIDKFENQLQELASNIEHFSPGQMFEKKAKLLDRPSISK